MRTKKIKQIFRASILMIMVTLIIVGILQLTIDRIKAVTDSETETVPNESEYGSEIVPDNAGTLVSGDPYSSFNTPKNEKDLPCLDLGPGNLAPLIEGYQIYCIEPKQGHVTPGLRTRKSGGGYFTKSELDKLSSEFTESKCTVNTADGYGHAKITWKETEQHEWYNTVTGAKDYYNTVQKIELTEHTDVTMPEKIVTPPLFTAKDTIPLTPAMAYIVSSDPQGEWSQEKQFAIWNLRGKQVFNEVSGEYESADGSAIKGTGTEEYPNAEVGSSADALTQEALRYAEYHNKVQANGGLNPQNISTGVKPKVNMATGQYIFGPFSMKYVDDGTAFDGGKSFAGITDMYVIGYNSKGASLGQIPIASVILGDDITGGFGGGSSLQFFNPSGSELVDTNKQVYPRSEQPFYVVISNPNVGKTSEDECVTSISVKVKFQYMLAKGEATILEGKQYTATLTAIEDKEYEHGGENDKGKCFDDSEIHKSTETDESNVIEEEYWERTDENGETKKVYEKPESLDGWTYHEREYGTKDVYTTAYGCKINVAISSTDQQEVMAPDARRVLYEKELDLFVRIPEPEPTPTPTPTPPITPTPPTSEPEEEHYKYENTDFSFNLGGNVWEDAGVGKEGLQNGLKGQEDISLKNIKVTLYFADTNELAWPINTSGKTASNVYSYINPTYTDENGKYEFRGLDQMRKYYVKFEYDGQIYMPTDYLTYSDINSPEQSTHYSSAQAMVDAGLYNSYAWKVNSKATEKNSERTAYDNKFGVIGSYPENYKTNNSLGLLQGEYNTTFSRLDLMGYTLGADGKYHYDRSKQLLDGYLYDEQGLETNQYQEGIVTEAIKKFIVGDGTTLGNYRYPNTQELKDIYTKIVNGNTEIAKKLQFIEDTKISAYTKPQNSEDVNTYDKYAILSTYTINLSEDHYTFTKQELQPDGTYKDITVYVDEYNYTLLYDDAFDMNLGLVRRVPNDVSLTKDVYKAALTINGQTQTYTYNGDDEDDERYWEISARVSDYEAYYSPTYNRELYSSDVNADSILNNEQNKLQVYVTYKISIRNSASLLAQIDEVVDYYDETYEFMPNMSWVMYKQEDENRKILNVSDKEYLKIIEGQNLNGANALYRQENSEASNDKYKPVQSSEIGMYSENTRYNDELRNYGYKTIYINGLKDNKLATGTEYIYLTFKVGRDQNGRLLLDDVNSSKKNIAEINGYSTWYKDGTTLPNDIQKSSNDHAGILDMDSNPGNFSDATLRAIQTNPNGKQIYEHNFEDDTDRAKGIRIYADNSLTRKINGTVWEDKRTYSPNGTNALIGNGLKEDGEVSVAGVQVTLHEVTKAPDGTVTVNPNVAKIFKAGSFVDAITTTASDGTYNFEGYIPGDYIVRFTYNGKTYNAQDYKSTSYQMNLSTGTKIDQNGRTDISGNDVQGYVGYTDLDKQNESATYGYDIAKADEFGLRVSDAKDIWSIREGINNKYAHSVTNAMAEEQAYGKKNADGTVKYEEMRAETGVIRVEVEYNREFSVGSNKESNNSGNIKYANGNEYNGNYVIQNLDFGLEERPKAGLELDKKVSNVKITLSDRTVLFDATQSVEDLIWQAKQSYNINNMKNETTYDNVGPKASNPDRVYSDYTRYNDFRQAVLDRVATMVNSNKGLIQATMDEEIMHGATIEITYDMSVTNIGEEDYNETSFYYIGKVANKNNIVKTSADLIIDYVPNNLKFAKDQNATWNWNPISQADISANGYVNKTLQEEKINGKYNTIITTDSLKKDLVPVGSSKVNSSMASTKLILTQTITAENTADDLLYSNIAEIVSISNAVGRRMAFSIQGNQDPTANPAEPDASRAEDVVILPPFGTHYLYIGLAIFITTLLIISIIVIKKRILK